MVPLKMLPNADVIDCNCPNLNTHCEYVGWIKDGFLHTNFDCGKVYISYEGQMEDEDGNLLVPDHDLLNEYYETATKERILENLMMNDEPNIIGKLNYIKQSLRIARNNALSMVNTPDFAEMRSVWEMNRKAQYSKYYDMFKSYQNYPNNTNSFLR